MDYKFNPRVNGPRLRHQTPRADDPPPPYTPSVVPSRSAQPTPPASTPPHAAPPVNQNHSFVPESIPSNISVLVHRTSRALPVPPSHPPGQGRRPTTPPGASGLASLSTLPLGILHRIVLLTLDPRATPDRFAFDPDIESVRRVWAMFCGLRGVDRRFFLVSTSILRDLFLPKYNAMLINGTTSDPVPPPGRADDPTSVPVFERRSREAAVLDRFVAVRAGEDLRKAESELCEDLGTQAEIFTRFQPAARIEDLLLRLSPKLIAQSVIGQPDLSLPLPHSHLSVILSPLWAQLFLSFVPVTAGTSSKSGVVSGSRAGKVLVCEVRRSRIPEDIVQRMKEALEDIARGLVPWGGRVG